MRGEEGQGNEFPRTPFFLLRFAAQTAGGGAVMFFNKGHTG
jgi:hypothetical protein